MNGWRILLAGLASLAVLSGCGRAGSPLAMQHSAAESLPVAELGSEAPAELPPIPASSSPPQPASQRPSRSTASARAPRLPRGLTVRGALRRALLSGAISRRRHQEHRATWWRAQQTAGRLTGLRRRELVAVLRSADRLAAGGLLTTSRIAAVMLTVRRNREFWSSHPLPAPRSRHGFRRDPLVYQYYPGHGLQIQPLASFGRANAVWRTCTPDGRRRGWRCRAATLTKLLDRLLEIGAWRGGYLAFEYLMPFGGGTPPWVSGMTQATAAQALARAADVLGKPRFRQASLDALGAFERRPPLGVAVRVPGGLHYLMYSFNPSLRILNGFLQSVRGLHDVSALTGSRRARRLFARADRVARQTIPAYDTGAWSLYSRQGAEATVHYHRLAMVFAGGLCRVTGRGRYCSTYRRFARYLGEPPRVRVTVSRHARAGRRLAVHVTVSKRSTVALRARRGADLVLRRQITVPRGTRAITWVPRRSGRHRIAVAAVAANGRRATQARPLAIAPLRRPARAPGRASRPRASR